MAFCAPCRSQMRLTLHKPSWRRSRGFKNGAWSYRGRCAQEDRGVTPTRSVSACVPLGQLWGPLNIYFTFFKQVSYPPSPSGDPRLKDTANGGAGDAQ